MLRALRSREGLTQQQLADKLEVTNTSVSLYEHGKRLPGRKTLTKLYDALNLSTDEFMLMLQVTEKYG